MPWWVWNLFAEQTVFLLSRSREPVGKRQKADIRLA